MRFILPKISFVLASAAFGFVSSNTLRAQAPIDFETQIQPIFRKSCYGCHGPKMQLGQLRLDVKSAGGQSGKLLTSGKSAESLLFQRISGLGDQPRMPMGGKLTPEQIATIKTWIEQGAKWPETVISTNADIKKHWAFIAPQRPAEPAVQNVRWSNNAIDRFILARLEKEQLSPSPEADRATLLRRLTLDLTGLPPTSEEVDAFLTDRRPDAYARQVDRLLASPHYGERWGRVWLDAARYADSDGYEKDKPRQVWFYRDWVINALNADLPYNEFIIRQIAGDLLPHRTQSDLVATGFLRNSMTNEEGGIDPEQFRMEAMYDRMEAIGKGVLGVTVQCAQCHNHKFDPVKQEDYYRMMAFLNDSNEANVAVYSPADDMKRAALFGRMKEIEVSLQHRTSDWEHRMAAWEASVRDDQPKWTTLQFPEEELSSSGQKLLLQPDGSVLAAGDPGINNPKILTSKTTLGRVTAVRLELLTDPDLPRNGPGRNYLGTCALSEFSVEAAPLSEPAAKPAKVRIAAAAADFNQAAGPLENNFLEPGKVDKRTVGPIEFAIDGKKDTAWSIDAGPGRRNQSRKAVFTFAQPIEFAGGAALTLHIDQMHGGGNIYNNNLGRFRLSVTNAPNPTADPLPKNVRDILAIARDRRTPEQTETVFRYWRTTVPAWQAENNAIEALWNQHPEGSYQLVLQHMDQPRQTHVLTRGDYLKPAKPVGPGVPAFLNPLPADAAPNRLTFAKWLVDRQSPTTARAFVNRVWQGYFGTGIVATSEDLGTQSEAPSHAELLDWLAVEFMDSGWSMKHLHKLIAMSGTYRQSSHVTPELYQKDPYNRLLARGPRFRVDAESVRDIALAASGLLTPTIGGPSVYPPAPDFLFKRPVSFSVKEWFTETGANRYRRALYTFRYRSVPYPMLQTFDAPNGDVSCVRRARSNTPLQALTLLNEPLFMETAQALAAKTLQEGGPNDESRIAFAFKRCTGRTPTRPEVTELMGLLKTEQHHFTEAPDAAQSFANKADNAPQTAAWTAVSRVLLNLDETITKE